MVEPQENALRLGFPTVVDALEGHAKHSPNKRALSLFGTHYTFAEVAEKSSMIGAWMAAAGLGYRDRAIVQLQNVPQFVFATIAAWQLGAVVVPVSPMYTAREIHRLAVDSEAKVWITTPAIWAKQGEKAVPGTNLQQVVVTEVEEFASDIPSAFSNIESADFEPGILPVTRLNDILAGATDHVAAQAPLKPGDLAMLTYTSGTTGPPKGAQTTHENLAYVGSGYAQFHGVGGPNQVVLTTAPLVHITGLAMHLASWLMEGSQLVLNYRFHPAVQLDQIEATSATWTTGTSTAYTAMIEEMRVDSRDVTSLLFAGCGGATVSAEFARRFRRYFGLEVSPGYGLTETTGAIASTPPQQQRVDEETGIMSVGIPLFKNKIRIVNDQGDEVKYREHGEILIAGPAVVDGFWGREEQTAEQFIDGWVKTGDVGYLDEEGWLYVVDRTKNLIVASGYKVWPREVEEVLATHEAVNEVAVVGAPDDYRGETVVAFVSYSSQHLHEESFAEELRDLCRSQLAAYKVPSRIVVRDALPKNFNGKIMVRDLRHQASSGNV